MNLFAQKRKFLVAVTVLLVAGNVYLYWPSGRKSAGPGGDRPPGPPPGEEASGQRPSRDEMRQRMEEAIAKLPEDQQAEIKKRMDEDRAFFDSLKDLPEDQRREKMREHFASNPPPQIPGMEKMGPPPGGGPGGGPGANSSAGGEGGSSGGEQGRGPGGPGGGHIPEPSSRYSMDKNIVQSMKTGTSQSQ